METETRALRLVGIKVGLGEALADLHWDAGPEETDYGMIVFTAGGVAAEIFTYNLNGHRTHRSVYPDRVSYWLIVDAKGAAVAGDMLANLYGEDEGGAEEPDHKLARLELTAALRALFPAPVKA